MRYQQRHAVHSYHEHQAVASSDACHRAEMERGSASLRDRVLGLLAERRARFTAQIAVHESARADIRAGVSRDEVMRRHGLSATAYQQLKWQVGAA